LVTAAKILVAATKILFVVPNFVAVTKPFFFRATQGRFYAERLVIKFLKCIKLLQVSKKINRAVHNFTIYFWLLS